MGGRGLTERKRGSMRASFPREIAKLIYGGIPGGCIDAEKHFSALI
jgi:hypothetical protein